MDFIVSFPDTKNGKKWNIDICRKTLIKYKTNMEKLTINTVDNETKLKEHIYHNHGIKKLDHF